MLGFDKAVVLITCSDGDEAQMMAEALLRQRKAACVNIVSGVGSRFWWKGGLDSAEETLLLVKTRASLVEEVIGLVRELHSYEVPEIIALPIVAGNPDYLDWVDGEVQG